MTTAKERFERIKDKTLEIIEQNPILAVVAIGTVLTGGAKLMDSNTRRKNAKVWKDEVERRRMTGIY